MEGILKQAPNETTINQVEDLLKKYDGNIPDVLAELWEIKPGIKKEEDSKQHKWTEIRELCNEFDLEMDKYMKK